MSEQLRPEPKDLGEAATATLNPEPFLIHSLYNPVRYFNFPMEIPRFLMKVFPPLYRSVSHLLQRCRKVIDNTAIGEGPACEESIDGRHLFSS